MSAAAKYIWRVQWSSHSGRVPRNPIYVDAANSRRARNLAIHRLMKDEPATTQPLAIMSITAIADSPADAGMVA